MCSSFSPASSGARKTASQLGIWKRECLCLQQRLRQPRGSWLHRTLLAGPEFFLKVGQRPASEPPLMDCGCWTANSRKHPELLLLAGPGHQVKAREGWSRLNPYGERLLQTAGGRLPRSGCCPPRAPVPRGPRETLHRGNHEACFLSLWRNGGHVATKGGALSFEMNSKSPKAFWKRRKFSGGPIWHSLNNRLRLAL